MDTSVVRDQFEPVLSREELESAKTVNLVDFPVKRVIRSDVDPPILDQNVGLVSFVIFKQPQKTKTGELCFGLFKLRGNYQNEKDCDARASLIIRETDSANRIFVSPVGKWLPLTSDLNFAKDFLDVKINEDEIQLRDQAAKEKQSDSKKVLNELNDRIEKLTRPDDDIYSDRTTLRYYAMRRITEMKVLEEVGNYMKKLDSMRETLVQVRTELKNLEAEHSDYSGQWISLWNEERKKTGTPAFLESPGQFKDYENWSLKTE
jgi:Family of unknown function (DUF5832)